MSKKYRDEHFELFGAHTLLKHAVLDRYVKAWIQILKRTYSKIWIVDGFAGKGKDAAGNPGSPLLLARSAAQLRGEAAEVYLLAVEPRTDWFAALKANLAEFDAEADGAVPVAYIRQGALQEVADEVFSRIGAGPAFVFLDPFGADGLELEIVRRILALEKGEVFALFSHSSVCRHLAVLAAESRGDRARRALVDSPTLFPEQDAEWLASELSEAQGPDSSLLPTREAANRILTELFGDGEVVRTLLDSDRARWGNEVVAAYLRALKRCGATHITPIAIFDGQLRCTYFLIHTAKSGIAARKMKEAFRAATNLSALPDRAKSRIRWVAGGRLDEIVSAVLLEFAGEVVHWADQRNGQACVRNFALEETGMFPQQAKELQEALTQHVIQKAPKKYQFPIR